MACFRPIDAWKPDAGGSLVFKPIRNAREIRIPCGQCIGCRLEKSRQWAVRCMHEAQSHKSNSFVTLTYSDEKLPWYGALQYPDFQLFMKRLRKRKGAGVRFYMCGEYGEKFLRPHYHACLFGVDFPDAEFFKITASGEKIYTSKELDELWPLGHANFGELTFESAAYVARYAMKKVTGKNAEQHYTRADVRTMDLGVVPPEFARMSLRKAVGRMWIEKYTDDVYTTDNVYINDRATRPPRYYDEFLKVSDPDRFEHIRLGRMDKAFAVSADNTNDRLRVREEFTRARLRFKSRSMDQ